MGGKACIDPYPEEIARKYFVQLIHGIRYLHFQVRAKEREK